MNAEQERDALRAFAQEVMDCWPNGDVDGGDLQGMAEKHGLLKPVMMGAPCGEACGCAEFCSDDDFPVECFRKTSLLTGRPESDARIAELIAAVPEVKA